MDKSDKQNKRGKVSYDAQEDIGTKLTSAEYKDFVEMKHRSGIKSNAEYLRYLIKKEKNAQGLSQ